MNFGTVQPISQNNGLTVLAVAAPTASTSLKMAFSQRLQGGAFTQTAFIFNTKDILDISAPTSGSVLLANYNNTGSGVAADSQIDGLPHCWIAGNSASSGYIFRDGVKQTLSVDTRTVSTLTNTSQQARIGNVAANARTTEVHDDPLFLVVVWDRMLSEAEAKTVSANPWQLFRPIQRRIWVEVGGGGATNYTLTADVGAYTLTGEAATTSRGVRMTGDVGSYALTGQDATTSRGYSLTGDVGAYSLTGESAGTQAGFRIGADTGAYSLTGQDATLTYSQGTTNYTLTAETGNYTLTGVDAGTIAGRRLVADVGAYSLTGQNATTSKGTRLVADVGAYTLTGQDATLTATATVNYTLACETGQYLLDGLAAGLEYTDGSAPTKTAGFVITDTAPRMWWQRKPKALDDEEAEQRVERVVRVVERIARAQVEQPNPAPQKVRKAEVREAIAPLVEQMPGFDWMAVYRTVLIELERRKQEEQALELAAAEIARIRAIEQDDEDVLLLLMSV